MTGEMGEMQESRLTLVCLNGQGQFLIQRDESGNWGFPSCEWTGAPEESAIKFPDGLLCAAEGDISCTKMPGLGEQGVWLVRLKAGECRGDEIRWLYPEEALQDKQILSQLGAFPHFHALMPELSCLSGQIRVPCGRYRHFKGNEYRVLSVALHSETLCPMVVYQALYGGEKIWVRPLNMWTEFVQRDGKVCRRFEKIPEKSEI